MKTLKFNKFILLLIGLVAFNSCVEDDDFSIPNTQIVEPNLTGNVIEISSVSGQLAQEQGNSMLDYSDRDTVFTYPSDGPDQFVSGYIVSSDEGGNYFEELILQNSPENPTMGIRVLVDVNPLFTRYEVGRKVFVKVNGLSIGISNGVLSLGPLDGNFIGKIPAASEEDFIQRSTEVATIVPLPLEIGDFTEDKTNLMVELNNVQFNRSQALAPNILSYASESFDQFDGERLLESCVNGATTIFATSTFSDFKGLSLPSGQGSMVAVLQRNFFGDAFNIVVNSPEDINFDNPERCDPIILSCGLGTAGNNNLFADDFESQTPFSLVTGNGWTNFIQEGTEGWEAFTQGGTNASQGISARVGSFGSGDASSIAWLITPQVDLDANNGVTFQFESSNSFSDGSEMEVLFSKDWDGTEAGITNATWGLVEDARVVQDSDFFGDWFESGVVDLSCETGQIYLAFRYTGSGNAAFDGTYELDFVSIDAQ